MSKKLKYKIISCSSQENQFPVSSLIFNGQNGGWQTKRFCTYPQQVTFQFYGPVKIDKIEIISDNRKVPSQVDILHFLPFATNGRQAEQRFQKYGFLNFYKNQNSQYREQKSIMVQIKCLYLRFLFHKPHHSKQNFFSQVGIQQITIMGSDSNALFAPLQKLPRQMASQNQQYIEEDLFIQDKLSQLNQLKERAVSNQDFQQANQWKIMIDFVKRSGEELNRLQMEKRIAIEEEDYQKANNMKKSIQEHKKQIQKYITTQAIQDTIIEQHNQHPNLNDFQDNEFVDPQMSQTLKKSILSKSHLSMSNSKVTNSRIKINRSLLKKQKQKAIQNYDQRVIPTMVGGKTKTEESQFQDKEDEKKQFQPEEINGKYLQFALVMQEHFTEDVVKCFFSSQWQLKVQALTSIQSQIKKKQNPDTNFIKSLIIVVKSSLGETNFQVSLNSLQVLHHLLQINSKGNLMNRTHDNTNDLDLIIRQTLKKLTDNNNKIRQQAQKVFTQMINSSLYGPETCAISLTKSKQKTKLSAKQILTRIVQLSKIVQGKRVNQQVLALAIDYAAENVKNPAIEVRNQSINLLNACKSKDLDFLDKRLVDKKNILTLLQTVENKSKVEKPKKKAK